MAESIGMLMIGDGALALVRPQAHCRLWRGTNEWWSGVVAWFIAHPTIVRTFGAFEVAGGFWIAWREEDRAQERRAATECDRGAVSAEEAARRGSF